MSRLDFQFLWEREKHTPTGDGTKRKKEIKSLVHRDIYENTRKGRLPGDFSLKIMGIESFCLLALYLIPLYTLEDRQRLQVSYLLGLHRIRSISITWSSRKGTTFMQHLQLVPEVTFEACRIDRLSNSKIIWRCFHSYRSQDIYWFFDQLPMYQRVVKPAISFYENSWLLVILWLVIYSPFLAC